MSQIDPKILELMREGEVIFDSCARQSREPSENLCQFDAELAGGYPAEDSVFAINYPYPTVREEREYPDFYEARILPISIVDGVIQEGRVTVVAKRIPTTHR